MGEQEQHSTLHSQLSTLNSPPYSFKKTKNALRLLLNRKALILYRKGFDGSAGRIIRNNENKQPGEIKRLSRCGLDALVLNQFLARPD